jgi:hypothetical protein
MNRLTARRVNRSLGSRVASQRLPAIHSRIRRILTSPDEAFVRMDDAGTPV